MLDSPRMTTTAAQLAAIIPLTIPREEIQEVMGPGITEVMAAVSAQGIGPTDPWFTRHPRMDPGVFDFEIGVPVRAAVKPLGRVKPRQWPAMKVVRTVYHGPYEDLAEAWGEFDGRIESQGLKPSDELWECYLAGPESGSDSATWRTQLSRRLLA